MSREIKYRVKVTWCDEVRIAQVTDMGFGKITVIGNIYENADLLEASNE
ncbi:hypothetical protein HX037_06560 [Ignatzschineria indica]|nr:YopX family protein [Ignatzschineria indica]MDM1545546.1 hypothetical protein [Ignatzschineria indica]